MRMITKEILSVLNKKKIQFNSINTWDAVKYENVIINFVPFIIHILFLSLPSFIIFWCGFSSLCLTFYH